MICPAPHALPTEASSAPFQGKPAVGSVWLPRLTVFCNRNLSNSAWGGGEESQPWGSAVSRRKVPHLPPRTQPYGVWLKEPPFILYPASLNRYYGVTVNKVLDANLPGLPSGEELGCRCQLRFSNQRETCPI